MTSDETAALRATAHPLRLQILSILTGTAMSAAAPPTGPISSLAIWPRDLPFLLMEKKSVVMSWTAPASMTPTMIQIVPGK